VHHAPPVAAPGLLRAQATGRRPRPKACGVEEEREDVSRGKKWRGPVDSCGGGEENKGKEKEKEKEKKKNK
jgi:hypothetical protein